MTPRPTRRLPQTQASLVSQIETVRAYFRRETPASDVIPADPRKWYQIANMLGCYDAADHFGRQQIIMYSEVGGNCPDEPSAVQMRACLVEVWYASEYHPAIKHLVEACIGKPDDRCQTLAAKS